MSRYVCMTVFFMYVYMTLFLGRDLPELIHHPPVLRKTPMSMPVGGGHHQQEKVWLLFLDALLPTWELQGHGGAAFLISLVPVSTRPRFLHTIAWCPHPLPTPSPSGTASSRVLCLVVALWPLMVAEQGAQSVALWWGGVLAMGYWRSGEKQ